MCCFFSSITFANENKDNLFVFVGQKISVTEAANQDSCLEKVGTRCVKITLDGKLDAKYRVIESVHGVSPGPVINFYLYNHYGRPDFANYKYALIFVSKNEENFVSEKYRNYEVYRTRDGKWATCGENVVSSAKLLEIQFQPAIYHDISHYSDQYVEELFPASIWRRDGDKIFCRQGVYVDELYRIEIEEYLKLRSSSDIK